MKILLISIIVILCTGLVFGHNLYNDAWFRYISECAEEVKASPDDIRRLTSFTIDSRNAQCLLACLKKKTGEMNADNSINLEKTMEMLEKLKAKNEKNEQIENAMKRVPECKRTEKIVSDECLAVKNYLDCMRTKVETTTPK